MPANQLSQHLTTAYRQRLDATRDRLQILTQNRWPSIDELDSTDWSDRMAAAVTQAQTEAVRATTGYLAAYLSAELGKRVAGPPIDSRSYTGKSRDGRDLQESLRSPLVAVLGALKDGKPTSEALAYGLERGTRIVGLDFDHAHRTALLETIKADERFDGWQRVTTGTCGACAAKAGKLENGVRFQIHPGCGCVSQPSVAGVPDRFPVLTGQQIFAEKTPAERDEMLGPEAAALVAAGVVSLDDLVEESSLEQGENFITQKPITALV